MDLAALLAEARRLDATEPVRAIELRERVIGYPMSPTWSEAHVELGALAYGRGEFLESEDHARAVLAAPQHMVAANARAIAGVLLCLASDGASPDEDDLRSAIEACIELGESYYAACGLTMLAKRRPEVAASALAEAVTHFDRAGSTFGGPGALRRLALIAFAQQRFREAHSSLQTAIEHLGRAANPAAHELAQRLATLRMVFDAFRIGDIECRPRIERVLGRPLALDELALRDAALGEDQLALARRIDGADPSAAVLYLRLVLPRLDPERAEELITHALRGSAPR